MNASATALTRIGSTESSTHSRLQGAWLWVVRSAWVAIALLAIAIYAAAAPVAFNLLRTPCDVEPCEPGQPSSAELRAFQEQYGLSPEFGAWYHTFLEGANRLVTLGVALLIFWRRSDEWTALIASFMLVTNFAIFSPSPMLLANAQPLWNQPLILLRVIALTSTVSLFYLFPDGRFVPRWSRWLAIAVLVIIGIQAAAGAPFQSGFPVFMIALVSGAGVQIYRYRKVSDPLQRQQTKWVVLGIAGMVLPMFMFFVFAFLNPSMNPLRSTGPIAPQDSALFSAMITACVVLPLTFFPVTLAISILRYRLWDVDVVINRALVYGSLTALIAAIYILIVGGLSTLFQAQTNTLSGLVAAAVIAVLFQPVRERLQRAVNRLLYGERDNPAAVLTRLAHHLETADTPTAILPSLVQTIAHTLKIPYVAVWQPIAADRMVQVAAWGEASEQMQTIPLTYQNEAIGHLIVAPRGPQERFNRHEQDLLATIAALTATTVRAVQLSDELRRSRQHIISAREEERRRLRRDLHDGLGPQLASQMLGLEAVAQLMPTNPERALALLDSLKTQAQDAIFDVRRLVYDLRPPALDDLGLIGALRQSASRYETDLLRFSLDVPQSLPELPAAIETAVYRIAQEGMTNVVRHAEATCCTVRLRCTDTQVIVEVRDNGRGLQENHPSGVGLQAIKERTTELNGQYRIDPLPEGGTLVQARLPLGVNGG